MSLRKDVLQYINQKIGCRAVPRTISLHKQAHKEEGLKVPQINHPTGIFLPLISCYPQSYVERISSLNQKKKFDYNFQGVLFDETVYAKRKWILDFAKQKFTDASYFCITDAQQDYQALGSYDYTLDNLGQRFIPRRSQAKAFFDENYYRVMCQSKFTLCPAGDAPWSIRFSECILCKSIPIVKLPKHTGRTRFERKIGYKYYLSSEKPEYRQDWVEENYSKLIKYQTLLTKPRPFFAMLLACAEKPLTGLEQSKFLSRSS
ncbi:MAG: exostosin family protein [Cyanobacteria bacterium P01_F01_bin.86]